MSGTNRKYTVKELTGQCEDLMINAPYEDMLRLKSEVLDAFRLMEKAAGEDGVSLWIFSGFRSLSEQIKFWDDCMEGRREVDFSGKVGKTKYVSEIERLTLLMKWVAVPGTSRHHWGTDVDIIGYHPVKFPDGYRERRRSDFMPNGMYERQFQWLLKNARKFDFVQPYDVYRGGIEMEPWHWSYAPLSRLMLREYLNSDVLQVIRGNYFSKKDMVMSRWKWYNETFVININPELR